MRPSIERTITVVVAVLLVTATFTPAVIAASVDASTEHANHSVARGSSLTDAVAAQLAVRSPREQKRRATSLVENLSVDRRGGADRKRQRAARLLGATLDDYRDPTRVTREAVFRNDSEAVQALAGLAGPNSSTVDLATQLVVQADRQTTVVALADARRALNLSRARIDSPGQVRSAEAHLDDAERALARANQTLRRERGSESKAVRDRARAIRHLATAWRQAQLALDGLDAATTPRVTITSRGDPVRNGSTATTRRIAVSVFDVRAYEFDDVTLTVGGDRSVVVSLNGTTAPAENVTAETRVEVRDRVTTVEARVTDAGTTEDGEESGDVGGPPGQSGGDDSSGDATGTGTDVLRLDGDGLRDTFEVRVVETDPLDPDSDASVTDADESDDGVVDGAEDFDGDTLVVYDEQKLGTSPLRVDSDGDGLDDRVEVTYASLSPTDADSDGDGTPDPVDDPDGDGLTTEREVDLGTSPFHADTDLEGLNDSAEVDRHGTDPVRPDTDGDGLTDAEELKLGTDPTVADTDGDGTPDGEETFETTTTEETTGVAVTVRGRGDAAAATEVTPKPSYFAEGESAAAAAGPTVRIENGTAVESATVRIPIDESVPQSEYDDLAVFKWNGSVTDAWSTVETTIEDGAAVATVDSFSYFTVLDADEWTGAVGVGADPTGNGSGGPLALESQSNFTCTDACMVTNETTLLLGGEPSARTITVEQGNQTFEVVPLSNGQAIDEFYDYGNAKINSPLPIAKSDVSRLFLWSGPNGISLVVLHDKGNDSSGGAVSMDFEGLPTSQGSWIIKDDPGDFQSETRFDWAWADSKTDGGVYRGGLTNESVTIQPRFNDEAGRNPLSPGTLVRWEALTGQATAPENVTLSRDQPVTVTIPAAPTENESAVGPGPGDSGTATWTLDASRSDQLTIFYQTEQTDVQPNATLTVTGASGTTVEEALNVGTVGTVRQVVNLTALDDGPATVTVSADGVNFRAEIVAGAGGSTDSDGDGIPDAVERATHTAANGRGETFTTDPFDADTDNDGVPDGEEVAFRREVVAGELVTTAILRSDPTEVDTDGDGLTDRREHESDYTIQITTSPEATENLKADARGGSGDPTAHLTTVTTLSSPYLADTDGDGIDDGAELSNGTDPNSADTDGDGIPDVAESGDAGDPTLFDATAPTVKVRSLSSNLQKTHYEVTYVVTDPSGVETVEFLKGGEVQATRSFGGATDTGVVHTGFDVPTDDVADVVKLFGRAVEESILGTKVTVRVRDSHGNEREKIRRGPAALAQLAKWIADTVPGDIIDRGPVLYAAYEAGVFFALGQSVSEIIKAVTNLVGFFEDLKQMVEVIFSNPGFVTRLPALFVGSIASNQRVQNPFAPTDDVDNATFATGWYAGYVAGFIVEAIVGSKGSTKLVDSLGEFSSTIGRLQDAYGGLRAAISGATVSPAKQFALQFGRELRDVGFSTRAGKAVLESVSVAKQFLLKQRLRVQLGRDVVDGLSDDEQRFLGEVAKRTDADGVRGLRQLDEDGTLDDIMEVGGCKLSSSVSASGAVVLSAPCELGLEGVESDELARVVGKLSRLRNKGFEDSADSIVRAIRDDDVDTDVLVEFADSGEDETLRFIAELDPEFDSDLDATEQVMEFTRDADVPADKVQLFGRVAGEDGAVLLREFDDDQLEAFFDLDADDADPDFVRERLARYAAGENDLRPDDVGTFATDVRRLESEGFDIEEKYFDSLDDQVSDGNLRRVKGDVGEARVARQLVDSDADTVEGLEVEGTVDEFVDFDGNTRKSADVEVDVETSDSLMEVKNGDIDPATIHDQIVKYAEFRDDPSKDIVVAVADTDDVTGSVEDAIKKAEDAIDEDVEVVEIKDVTETTSPSLGPVSPAGASELPAQEPVASGP